MGIVKVALLDVTVSSDLVFGDIHWVWFLLAHGHQFGHLGVLLPPSRFGHVFPRPGRGRGPLPKGSLFALPSSPV